MPAEERSPTDAAEIDSTAEDRLPEALGLIRRFQAGDYEGCDAAKDHGGGPGEILRELRALGAALASERKAREERLGALANTVLRLASLNFTAKAPLSHTNDAIDGIASGLNMLREELQHSTVSKVYLDNVFESMSDALLVANGDGTIRTVNQAVLDLLGYEEDELVGRSIGAFTMEPFSQADLAPVRGREVRCATKRGEEVTVSLSTSVLRGGAGGDGAFGFVCVLRDITARKREEEERRRLEEAIGAKDEVIRRMSTPLIPINEDIVVMPLVGAVDTDRANQIVESLLRGIASNHPRVAILDITAVALVDAEVASTIVRAANAARLLGVDVVLTGVRPEVAMTLVELGFDLRGVTACGTLQAGIALSMRRERRPSRGYRG